MPPATVDVDDVGQADLQTPEMQMVDAMTLYLSLRNSSDERVQQQLEQLIEEIKW